MWWSFIKAGDSSVNLLFSKYFASANMGFAQEGSVLTGCKIFLVLIASFKKSVAPELSYAYIYFVFTWFIGKFWSWSWSIQNKA